jgi:hypothetical protein
VKTINISYIANTARCRRESAIVLVCDGASWAKHVAATGYADLRDKTLSVGEFVVWEIWRR